ncbi:hypothetical protein EDD27_9134 [Nonomuraea polychroma]|uniref:Uncharacterized protein n=1 Tax=Nonomuraea polychroma TaxID=46176 RepID=A0A438MKP4_9ACTN|nr:hypothetical protein [Nonomuraea polychroma]RVX46265.1 hypothetical protein EDD27_9134 [Nonomuraea polychroma]
MFGTALLFYCAGSLVLVIWAGVALVGQVASEVGDKRISESKEGVQRVLKRYLPWLVGGFLLWLSLLLVLIQLQISLSPYV